MTMIRKTARPHSALVLLCRRMLGDKRAATAIEYALMAAGIGMAVATTVWSVGSSLKTNFYDTIAALF